MSDPAQNIAQTIIEQIGKASSVQTLTGHPGQENLIPITAGAFDAPAAHVVAIPDGMREVDLTGELDRLATKLQPWRRTGTAKLSDIDSLIAWANRHKGPTSALFADTGPQPRLTCIADYLGEGAPVIDPVSRDPNASHMLHRAAYTFPLAAEWLVWTRVDGKELSGPELGEFVEANAKDLLEPTPNLLAMTPGARGAEEWEVKMIEIARQLQGRFGQYQTLVQLARNFQVNEVSNVAASLNRDTGESSIQFLNEHRDPDGAPIQVPNLFMIAIPVFDEGAAYRIPVCFRYRKAGQAVKFTFTLYTPAVYFRDALAEALDRAATETGLPLFRGAPEAPA